LKVFVESYKSGWQVNGSFLAKDGESYRIALICIDVRPLDILVLHIRMTIQRLLYSSQQVGIRHSIQVAEFT